VSNQEWYRYNHCNANELSRIWNSEINVSESILDPEQKSGKSCEECRKDSTQTHVF